MDDKFSNCRIHLKAADAGGGSRKVNQQRRKEILAAMERRDFLDTGEAAEIWHTSESSIRRDFTFLAENGLVRRVRGGIRRIGTAENASIPLPVRNSFFVEEKQAIARRASVYLPADGAIFLHGGSTSEMMLPYIERGCVITDSISLSEELRRKYAGGGGPEVILPGGSFDFKAGVLCGSRTESALAQYRVDVAFFSTRALDERGLLDTNDQIAAVLRTMIRHARKAVLLADHSKFSSFGIARVVGWEEIDAIITRRTPENAGMLEQLVQQGVPVDSV